MHSPDYLRKRALSRYEKFLLAWLNGEAFFPLSLSVGEVDVKNYVALQESIDTLNKQSKKAKGYGYVIESDTRRTRQLGEQTVPHHIVFETDDDYLRYLGNAKLREFKNFVVDVDLIRKQQPRLEDWLQQNIKDIINYHGDWDSLLTVCQYFLENPQPQRYARELPIEVHTKFIETHTGILDKLLQELLSPSTYDATETDFYSRYGILNKSPLIRIRLLDDRLQSQLNLPFDDFAIPIQTLANLNFPIEHCIIVENELSFLTLPPMNQSIAIWGGGFKVEILRDVLWLNEVDIIYWGDIDVQGFQILSNLRRHFPHIRSVMMNRETLDAFQTHILGGKQTTVKSVLNLTVDERKIYDDLLANNQRLEQEHISQSYVRSHLKSQ